MKDYNTKIKELRTYCEAKWGRKSALARALGVTPMLVTRWLREKSMISSKEWIAIEQIMKESEE